ncbi:hypothetical protein BaRGS_00010263, partial [Batillaria attramentaria]
THEQNSYPGCRQKFRGRDLARTRGRSQVRWRISSAVTRRAAGSVTRPHNGYTGRPSDCCTTRGGDTLLLHCQRLHRALDIFKAAADQSCLTADMFLEWVRLLTESLQVEEAERVGQLGVQRFPTSTDLWKTLLLLRFQSLCPASDVVACLNKALTKVPEK